MHKRIRFIRNFLGISLEQFSRELDFNIDLLYDIENRNKPVTVELIKKICYIFEVNEYWLSTGHGFKGDLFLKEFIKLNELSNTKRNLVKFVLSVDDYVIDKVFYDDEIIKRRSTAVESNDEIEKLVMSYENELNSEKNGIAL